ncbi:MAG: 30S ribosomal protein S17 [Acidobacteria bacterium]|nr:30S ribosomal protein S17 [Acidobacteriota bacterium]
MPRKTRSIKLGRVVSNGMNKSVIVAVDRLFEHPLYGKTIRRTSKFMAHDEENECQVGDKVTIEETRAMSKRKR